MTEEEKPLTREEVLKMIEEHGGPEGLDLCGRNLEGINLSSETKNEEFLHLPSIIISKGVKPLDLHGIVVIGANLQQAELSGANLQGANLFKAKLQGAFLIDANLRRAYLSSAELQGALLWHADLEGATLEYAELQGTELKEANLKGANLEYATLRGAYLEGFTIDSNTKLQNVDWGHDYMVREEKERWFQAAQGIYRILKQWHTQAGIYDIAGEFYFREMTVKRKALRWWPNPLPRA
ncbi:MAG: pentapeptide repeat-containing protein, partial [Chloroflexi bacterium]|nr:pentapeptide repeat-containing protein [Chloroflexota bacterium]